MNYADFKTILFTKPVVFDLWILFYIMNLVFPVNFVLNFDSIFWKNKIIGEPYAPIRGAYPTNADGKYQNHPRTATEKN